jgi:anti-anti-sigma factor
MDNENKELKIEQSREGYVLTCKLTGWLDPNTSPELVARLDLKDITLLIFDMEKVEYVFSSGIRAFLMLQKMLDEQGGAIKLINVSADIRSIFEYAGLESLLDMKA